VREVREREVTGESESEGERERYFLFKRLWGPDDHIMEIETPCPEYPGQWPEYPGVTGSRGNMPGAQAQALEKEEKFSNQISSRREGPRPGRSTTCTPGSPERAHQPVSPAVTANLPARALFDRSHRFPAPSCAALQLQSSDRTLRRRRRHLSPGPRQTPAHLAEPRQTGRCFFHAGSGASLPLRVSVALDP
jgi:hypothetical protein